MSVLISLINSALYVVFIQNLVFSGGLGTSEAIRMAAKPRRFLPFALFIAYFSTVSSIVCRIIYNIPFIETKPFAIHAGIFGVTLIILYLITAVLFFIIFKPDRKFLNMIGMSALNSMVFAIPLINRLSGNSLIESIGVGLGTGIAFIFAVALIGAGLKRIETNKNIPQAFKGAPAMFMYVALLSLAFTGLTN